MLESAELEPGARGSPALRAFLQVAGAPVAWHQLALALAADCRKIFCHAHALSSEIVSLQHAAEAAGAQFAVVTAPHQLAALVSAGDEVFVFSDGLLASPDVLVPLLDDGAAVLVQPDDVGLPQGFERIDINHAFAGALRVPGRLFGALADLPPDCDVVSSLTRIALQAGVAQVAVPSAARENRSWLLVRGEGDAHGAEVAWIDQTLRRDKSATPGAALGRLGVRLFAPALLHGGSGGNVVAAGAGAMVFMALVAGWFGFSGLALIILGLAAIARHAASLVFQVVRVRPSRFPRIIVFGILIDTALILLCAWEFVPGVGDRHWAAAALVPLLFVCLLRILAGAFERRWTSWLDDRGLICVILAIPAAGGLLPEAVSAFALVTAIAGAVLTGLGARLTRP